MTTHGIRIVLAIALTISGVAGCSAPVAEQTTRPSGGGTEFDRTVLPIAESSNPSITELNVRKATLNGGSRRETVSSTEFQR